MYKRTSEYRKIMSGTGKDRIISVETRERMSKAKRGVPQPWHRHPLSEEHRQKLSQAKKGKSTWNKGGHLTEEWKQKISKANKGYPCWCKGLKLGPLSNEHKRKISQTEKGKFISLETRMKMSEAHRGLICSEKTRHKISEAQKGKKSVMWGKRGPETSMFGKHHSFKTRKKISQANKGKKHGPLSEEHKQKLRETHLGKKLSEEHRIKLSESRKGQPGYWKGKHRNLKTRKKIGIGNRGKKLTEETKRKIGVARIGKHCSEETKTKISIAKSGKNHPFFGKHLSPEHVRKALRRRVPSILEKKFQLIITKHNLPYKFVGDGSFLLGSYNPDFISTNNKKILIEVFARYFKQLDGRNIENWKYKREKYFENYGWNTLFFNENELKNEKNIVTILRTLSF